LKPAPNLYVCASLHALLRRPRRAARLIDPHSRAPTGAGRRRGADGLAWSAIVKRSLASRSDRRFARTLVTRHRGRHSTVVQNCYPPMTSTVARRSGMVRALYAPAFRHDSCCTVASESMEAIMAENAQRAAKEKALAEENLRRAQEISAHERRSPVGPLGRTALLIGLRWAWPGFSSSGCCS
jgi:hypothetical protein